MNLGTIGTTFVSEISQTRPPFDQMVENCAWCPEANEKITLAMKRQNCQVSWCQLIVYQSGSLLLITFKHEVGVGAAKTAAGAILSQTEFAPIR